MNDEPLRTMPQRYAHRRAVEDYCARTVVGSESDSWGVAASFRVALMHLDILLIHPGRDLSRGLNHKTAIL